MSAVNQTITGVVEQPEEVVTVPEGEIWYVDLALATAYGVETGNTGAATVYLGMGLPAPNGDYLRISRFEIIGGENKTGDFSKSGNMGFYVSDGDSLQISAETLEYGATFDTIDADIQIRRIV